MVTSVPMMDEGAALETLAISVRPSPDTNDHEVLLQTEAGDLIERLSNGLMGLDPDDLLVAPCPLLPADMPRTVTIGRCDCGVAGCGSVAVTVERRGSVVVWSDSMGSERVHFDARAYEAEVRRALDDFSWETPDRTAARLIRGTVDRMHLERLGMEYEWASGRLEDGAMNVSLRLRDGPFQILLRVAARGATPEELAARCRDVLGSEPRTWDDVTWFPQAAGLGAPALAGRGWKPHRPTG